MSLELFIDIFCPDEPIDQRRNSFTISFVAPSGYLKRQHLHVGGEIPTLLEAGNTRKIIGLALVDDRSR